MIFWSLRAKLWCLGLHTNVQVSGDLRIWKYMGNLKDNPLNIKSRTPGRSLCIAHYIICDVIPRCLLPWHLLEELSNIIRETVVVGLGKNCSSGFRHTVAVPQQTMHWNAHGSRYSLTPPQIYVKTYHNNRPLALRFWCELVSQLKPSHWHLCSLTRTPRRPWNVDDMSVSLQWIWTHLMASCMALVAPERCDSADKV